PFFELSAVFGSGHERGQVQGNHTFIVQYPGNFLLNNPQGQTLGNGTFTNTGFPDQQRVVFLSPAEYLRYPFYFLFSSYYGVQFAFFGQLCQITPEIVQDRGLGFFGGFAPG